MAEEYEVEKVLAERGGEFRVKWRGFPLSEATWEPAAHLEGSAALVAAFRANARAATQKQRSLQPSSPGSDDVAAATPSAVSSAAPPSKPLKTLEPAASGPTFGGAGSTGASSVLRCPTPARPAHARQAATRAARAGA